MELRGTIQVLSDLYRRLFERAPAEGGAYLCVEPAGHGLVLHSYQLFEPHDLDGESAAVSLSEEAKVRYLAKIKRSGHSLVDIHTHPGSGHVARFSAFDESELPRFARYIQMKMPDRPYGAIVLGERGYSGRYWSRQGRAEPLVIRAIGPAINQPAWLANSSGEIAAAYGSTYDRQIRVLGADGQRRLAALRVAIVGLGGTGSLMVQELAHLGVRNFVLVDDDRVERSNLSRLAGASRIDAALGRRKTAVASRLIRGLDPKAKLATSGTLRSRATLRAIAEVDLLIGCVDNDGARLIMSEAAAAHLIPYADVGVSIESRPDNAPFIGGRVSFYVPGGPCLACADDLDFTEAAEDLESEGLRKIRIQRGYARDRRVEAALMPLNTVAVGLALIEILAYVTGLRQLNPFLRYDAQASRIINQQVPKNPDCPVCEPALAMGDRQRLERYEVSA